MSKLTVNAKKYAYFKYPPYLKRGEVCKKPKNPLYEVGDVVVYPYLNPDDIEDGTLQFAVVLGCIDEECFGELRTDADGMRSLSEVRHAVVEDLAKTNIKIHPELLEDLKQYVK